MVKKTRADEAVPAEADVETSERQDSRHKAIDAALTQIEQFGKGSIMKLGQKEAAVPVEAIPTGSISFDLAWASAAFPAAGSSRSTAPSPPARPPWRCTSSPRPRSSAAWRPSSTPSALSPAYAARIGIDIDNLLISQPDSGEQALEIAEVLVRSGAIDVIVIDSVAALVPKAEIEGEMGDSHMGLQARLMSQALRKLTAIVARSKTCFIFINQLREKIGVFFGNPETTTGGRALKFYASMRIDIRRMSAIKDGESVVGNRVKVKVVKNKMAPPFREAQFDIIFGEGISREGDLVDIGFETGILDKAGTCRITPTRASASARAGRTSRSSSRRTRSWPGAPEEEIRAEDRSHRGSGARREAGREIGKGPAPGA